MDKNLIPKVSVLMPVYNTEKYVAEAIQSILSQTFTDFEFIIINDGSTDNSEAIIQSFSDERIRYFSNKQNLGIVDTLNRGLDLCRGEYIARMDADDISLPKRFEKQVEFMDNNADVGVCGTYTSTFGLEFKIIKSPNNSVQAFTALAMGPCIPHPTAFIRNIILLQHKVKYSKQYEWAEDYEFWIQLTKYCSINCLPEILLNYRNHSSNVSNTKHEVKINAKKVQLLWYSYYLDRKLNQQEINYLTLKKQDKYTLKAGYELLLETVNHGNNHLIDIKYFGKLVITDFELKSIKNRKLIGLLSRLSDQRFRELSAATKIGLIVFFFKTMKLFKLII